ncbi:MAG: class I SAM-dependent methyltransferase [Gammaproteobacteria bacterium]|nr:class I SAM-dependent methyltransferase [Gammaproteobacteria bacterium]
MADPKQHYDTHLGPVYSWMTGDFAALRRRSGDLFDRLAVAAIDGGRVAVDLGAGHGAQSVPLAERGFDVVAIDFCRALLEELADNARGLPVTAVEGDLLDLERHVHAPAGAVVCMGDTLTHLPDLADVERLVRAAARVLAPGGKLVVTFRDYVSREPRGTERFIPVRADGDRILTCVLEYSPEHVTVYDLLHEKRDGVWKQRVGSYRKLRLDPAWLARLCEAAGLGVIESSTEAGVVTLAAQRR